MKDPLTPPDLPFMQPAGPATPSPTPTPSAQPAANGGMGTKRLRQAVGYLATGGMALVLMVSGGELVLRDGLKPSDLMATIEAQTEIKIMNQKLGAPRGGHVLTEAEYQETITNAQRRGQARAELAFQRDLAAVQADKERVVQAYGTLYQRTNMVAQAGLQMESQAQQFRQQLIASTNGGRSAVLAVEDAVCAMGTEESCEAARNLRAGMITEAGQLSGGDLSAKINELMSGIDDPATVAVRADQRRNGVPTIQH